MGNVKKNYYSYQKYRVNIFINESSRKSADISIEYPIIIHRMNFKKHHAYIHFIKPPNILVWKVVKSWCVIMLNTERK